MAVSSTHVFRFLGGHTITYGYQFEDDVYNDLYRYTGAPFQLPNIPALGPAAGQTVYWRSVHARVRRTPGSHSPIVLNFTRGNYYSSPPLPPIRDTSQATSRTPGRSAGFTIQARHTIRAATAHRLG